jgi:hypothetical protein
MAGGSSIPPHGLHSHGMPTLHAAMPAGAVRYCFRSLADATAFKRRFVDATQRRTVVGGN